MIDCMSDLQSRMYTVEHKVKYPDAETMLFRKYPNEQLIHSTDYDYFKKDTRDVVREILNHLGLEFKYQEESVELIKVKKENK